MASEIILGLDVSTKCIGICIYYYDRHNGESIRELTHLALNVSGKLGDIEKLFVKKKLFENEIISKYSDKGITKVIIEEPLLRSNNINTVDTLLKFNGMISDVIYNRLGIVPEYISSYDARKYAFPELMSLRKYGKDGNEYDMDKINESIEKNHLVLFGEYPFDCDKKLVLWNRISEMFPFINWVYDKDGELRKENFDASDALVTCLAYVNRQKYGEADFKIIQHEHVDKNTLEYITSVWDEKFFKKICLS